MEYKIKVHVPKEQYSTREQLYALCVLLKWPKGLSMSDSPALSDTVTLQSCEKGNTGLSAYWLETSTTATDVFFQDVPSLPYCEIFFRVLGIPLEVTFDEDGVGTVRFPQMPIAEAV